METIPITKEKKFALVDEDIEDFTHECRAFHLTDVEIMELSKELSHKTPEEVNHMKQYGNGFSYIIKKFMENLKKPLN